LLTTDIETPRPEIEFQRPDIVTLTSEHESLTPEIEFLRPEIDTRGLEIENLKQEIQPQDIDKDSLISKV
jgi:hypothetical protein